MQKELVILLAGLLAVVSGVASGQLEQRVEDFSDDPGWVSMGSMASGQMFGWYPEGAWAGGKAGEAGGRFSRSSAAYYAAPVGDLDPATTKLSAKGRMVRRSQGNILIGWFNSSGVSGKWEAAPSDFIGVQTNDNQLWATVKAKGGLATKGPILFTVDIPCLWRLAYDPTAGGGAGTLQLEVTRVDGAQVGTAELQLKPGDKEALARLDRFGLLSIHAPGGPDEEAYIDDVEFISQKDVGALAQGEERGVEIRMPKPVPPKLLSVEGGPLQVGGDKQLFIDEVFFASADGVRLAINQPVKDSEPVVRPDPANPWEANRSSSGCSVIEVNGEIRVYYDAISPSPAERKRWLCVAVSKDGKTFVKPKLGLVPFEGREDTNIVWPLKHVPSHEPGNVFIDTNPACPPAERFKLVYCFWDSGCNMAYSADGFNFAAYEPAPAFRSSDTTNIGFFDDRLGRYVAYVRINGPRGRSAGRCEFDDVRHWGPDNMVFVNNDDDQVNLDKKLFNGMDHYDMGAVKYAGAPDIYIGFPAAYYHFHKEVSLRRGRGGTRSPGNDGNIEAQLATSRDGVKWFRPEPTKPFIPRGLEGSWDYGMTYVAGGSNFIYRGEEVWIYYSAQPFTHGDYSLAEAQALGSVMRAVIRRDGFVSADAGPVPGEFTTPPMMFDGARLALNVDTGGGGWARVELQGADGKRSYRPIPGFTYDDCDTVNGNYVEYTVSWNGNEDVSALAGKAVRMRIRMRNTKLYAFQFAPAEKKTGA